ncbi:MAG TPA: hypothetical protein DD711_07175 [Acidimicrobium sp.]|nr:hypothetical protein [Acidimicrobium sp.]
MLKLFFCPDHAARFKNPIKRQCDCRDGKTSQTDQLSALNFFAFESLVVVIGLAVGCKFDLCTNLTL